MNWLTNAISRLFKDPILVITLGIPALVIIFPLYWLGLVARAAAFILSPVFGPFRNIVKGIFRNTRLYQRFETELKSENVIEHLEAQARLFVADKSVSPGERMLIEGRRRDYAELVAPEKKYPTLYCFIPIDLVRSIIWDGRVLNGATPATALVGRALTPEFVRRAWAHAVDTGLKSAFSTFLGCLALFAIVATFGGVATYKNISQSQNSQAENQGQRFTGAAQPDLRNLASQYEDIWNDSQTKSLIEKISATEQKQDDHLQAPPVPI